MAKDSVKQRLQQVFQEDPQLHRLQAVVRDAFVQGKFEPVFKYYFTLLRKGLEEQAALLRSAIAWTGYRFMLKDTGRLGVYFLQPFALKYTQVKEPFVPQVPPTAATMTLRLAYDAPEDFVFHCPGVLVSPSSFNPKDPRAAPLLVTQPPRLPVKPEQKAWHFRVWPVYVEMPLPFRQCKVVGEGNKLLADTVKTYAQAEDVAVLQPIEVFDVWVAYDVLNRLPDALEEAKGDQ